MILFIILIVVGYLLFRNELAFKRSWKTLILIHNYNKWCISVGDYDVHKNYEKFQMKHDEYLFKLFYFGSAISTKGKI